MAKSAASQAETTTEDANMGRSPSAATQAPTSLLSKLKFTDLKRSAAVNADPVIRARTKLVTSCQEQIKHIQAEIKGEKYEPTTMRYVTAEDGSRVREEGLKRRMLWYWTQSGTYFCEVRYGSSPVSFGGAGSAIECGKDLASVIEVLDVVIEATEKGELDDELATLAERRGRGRRGAPAPEPASPRERLAARTTRR